MFHGASSWGLKREKILTRQEVGKILDAAKKADERDYVFFVTAANTGLRLCELVHLRVDDLHGDQLRVTRRKRKRLQEESINLQGGVGEAILKWAKRRRSKPLAWLWPGRGRSCRFKRTSGEVVTLCDGGHVSRREMQRRWDHYVGKVGLDASGRGIHTLRHYAITEFYATHKDLIAAQQFAGHSSPMITTVYTHVLDMREKIQKVRATL